jgi:hypothetical protein
VPANIDGGRGRRQGVPVDGALSRTVPERAERRNVP